jgi:hypothetical protein
VAPSMAPSENKTAAAAADMVFADIRRSPATRVDATQEVT